MSTTVIVTLEEVQIYEFQDAETGLTYHWNATEGRRLAMERGAKPFTVNLAEAGITLKNVLDFAPELDTERAKKMNWGALMIPILFVPHGRKHVCIDGWHRIYKALYDGLQIKHLNELINSLCYGGAIAGAIWAGYLLVRIG